MVFGRDFGGWNIALLQGARNRTCRANPFALRTFVRQVFVRLWRSRIMTTLLPMVMIRMRQRRASFGGAAEAVVVFAVVAGDVIAVIVLSAVLEAEWTGHDDESAGR